jgi:L-glyceraldehyde 3-phosphate reductase
LRHKTITSVLVGASRVSQIEDNVAALNNLRFTEKELASIDAVLAG